MNRLAVRIAVSSLLVIALVGATVIVLVSNEVRADAETHLTSHVMRAHGQAAQQISTDAALRVIGASVLAGQAEFIAAVERGDRQAIIAIAETFLAQTMVPAQGDNGLRVYDGTGRLIVRAEVPDLPLDDRAHEAEQVAMSGLPTGVVRRDGTLGLTISGFAPVLSPQGQIVGVVEALTTLGPEYAEFLAPLLDTEVAVFDAGQQTGASSPGVMLDPAVIVAHAPNAGAMAPVSVPGTGTRYIAALLTFHDASGQRIGDIVIGMDEAEINDLVATLRDPIAGMVASGVVLAAALSAGLALISLQPLGHLAEAARRIQDNDLESPISVNGSREIQALSTAMEEMRRAVRQGRESLLLANRNLAHRVAESSTSLSEVTQDLEAMQRIVAQLSGESTGGLPAIVEELVRLNWVDGAFIALASDEGDLAPAAASGIAPGAIARILQLVVNEGPEGITAEVTIPRTAHHEAGDRFGGWLIGGLATQALFTPDGIAGIVGITATGSLPLTPQRRELLRAIAHEVAGTLERSELADEVEEHRRLAEVVLRDMSDGVVVVDRNDIGRIANPAAIRLLARPRTEIVGQPVGDWLPLRRNAIEALRRRGRDEELASAAPLVSAVYGRQIAVNASPFWGPDPENSGMLLLIHDLSAEAEAEQLKRDFVSMVGHELRTPLTLIRTTVDMLQEEDAGSLNPTQERIVEVLRHNSDRLMVLITDLLDMSALDSGRLRMNMDTVDIATVLLQAAAAIQPSIEEHQHTLHIDAPEGTLAWADAERIGQVLANLLSNAVKYTPPGGEIEARVETGRLYVTVTVSDNGIGITPQEQEHLFEKFYRADSGRRTTGGTGLGLAITRSIIELHGGTIRCESDGKRGTSFIFTLPRRPL